MTLTPSAHIDQFARNNLPQEAMQHTHVRRRRGLHCEHGFDCRD